MKKTTLLIAIIALIVGSSAVYAQTITDTKPILDTPVQDIPKIDTSIKEITVSKKIVVFHGTLSQLETRKKYLISQIELLQEQLNNLNQSYETISP